MRLNPFITIAVVCWFSHSFCGALKKHYFLVWETRQSWPNCFWKWEQALSPLNYPQTPVFRCLQSRRDAHMMMKRLLVTGFSGDPVHGLQTVPQGPLNLGIKRQHDCKTPDSADRLHTGCQKISSQYQDIKLLFRKYESLLSQKCSPGSNEIFI